MSTQVCRCGSRECRGSLGKRSDGRKTSPSDDERSSGRGKARVRGKDLPPKKIIRKKVVKALNARLVKHPLKTSTKIKPVTTMSPVRRRGIVVVSPKKTKSRRLSTTTVEKQSKRTVDEKELTTISLKKTKSKVFKVTKTYSKKEVTNSQVVKRTLVEEQPIKAKAGRKQQKTIEDVVKNTLKPQTSRRGTKTDLKPAALAGIKEQLLSKTSSQPSKKSSKLRKIDLICASPKNPPSKEYNSAKKALGRKVNDIRGWSMESDEESEDTKSSAKKRGKQMKSYIIPLKQGKQARKVVKNPKPKGIPPSRTKKVANPRQEEENDDDASAYETEAESSSHKIKEGTSY